MPSVHDHTPGRTHADLLPEASARAERVPLRSEFLGSADEGSVEADRFGRGQSTAAAVVPTDGAVV